MGLARVHTVFCWLTACVCVLAGGWLERGGQSMIITYIESRL